MPQLSPSPRIESTKSTAQVAAADKIARVLVGAIDLCSDAGWPLSGLQRVELLKAALLEFDGFEVEVAAMLELERRLSRSASAGLAA